MAEIQAVVAYEGENLPLIYTCLFLSLLFISVQCSGELDKQPVGRTATCLQDFCAVNILVVLEQKIRNFSSLLSFLVFWLFAVSLWDLFFNSRA